mgnify:CR=1 FL=1
MSADPADTASRMADAAGVEPERLPSLVQKAGVGMYPDAPADDAPEGVREAVEVWREEVPDAVKYEVPLLYWLLGAGTPDYKMPKDAAGYVDHPVDGMRCDNCEYYYEAPDGSAVCSQVRGDVEADHYCDLWEPLGGGADEKAWLPYEGPQGGTGWKNTETGDVRYTDEPPGETIEPSEPSPEDPMEVGDRVLLRYDGGTHAGEVLAQSSDPLPDEKWTRRMLDNYMDGETVEDFGGIDELVDAVWEAGEYGIDGMPEFSAPPPDGIEDKDDLVEAMMTLTSPSVRVKDDRNVWTFDAHDSEKYGGDMQILNLGRPESDRIEPEDADPRDTDQFAWALSEVQIEDAARMVVDAVDEAGVGPVMEAIEESDQSARLMSSEIVREFQSAGVSGGGVVEPDPLKDHTDPMREELTQEVLDDSEASTWRGARGGWQGSMYDDSRTEPLVAHAMDNTGNLTMPEYTMAAPSIIQDRPSDASKTAIEKASEFTTEKLREAFGDEVTLWRGLSENPHRGTPSEGTGVVGALREADESGEEAEVEHRPAESWSLSFDTAKLYASGGAVIETTVPVEDVLLSSSAGTLDAVEDDTVVQHEGAATYGPDQITTGDDLNETETRLRAALKNIPEDIE